MNKWVYRLQATRFHIYKVLFLVNFLVYILLHTSFASTASFSECSSSCKCISSTELNPLPTDLSQCLEKIDSFVVLYCNGNNWPEVMPAESRALYLNGLGSQHLQLQSNSANFSQILFLQMTNFKRLKIKPQSLSLFPRLKCIRLRDNTINSKWWASSLVPTVDLKELDLSRNHIHRLNETSFAGMLKLKK